VSWPKGAAERRLLASFGRARLSSPWWRAQAAPQKFCVRCGGRLARRWVAAERCRRLVCGACGDIAYQNPKVVGAALPVRNGKVYLARRDIEPSRGLWTFPSGYMELGETVEQAAARETWEEIRCRVKLLRLHGIYSYDDAVTVNVVYLARVVGAAPRPGPESQVVQAFGPREIPWSELAFRSTFHALRDWVRGLKKG
jgi:8-oxo-dGTP diphosphatase